MPKPFDPDASKPIGPQVYEYLDDTSHHVIITDDNIDEWLLLDEYRDKPWKLLTPRGTFKSRQLCERWIVPRTDGGPDDVFHLNKIIWHSDEDGWVAEYVERPR